MYPLRSSFSRREPYAPMRKRDAVPAWNRGIKFRGQNLPRDHHTEFADEHQSVNSSQVKRGEYAKFAWRV
jgi:hypothetical protein